MLRNATGTYAVSVAGSETVPAFVPAPLPPNPPLYLSNSRQNLLERATQAVGRLDSVSMLLPNPQLFLYAYVHREAVMSSQIEGTQLSLSDLLLFEMDELPGVPFDDVVEVSNYIAGLEHGMTRLRGGFPLCNRLLREIHEHLMARGRGSDKRGGSSQPELDGWHPSWQCPLCAGTASAGRALHVGAGKFYPRPGTDRVQCGVAQSGSGACAV